jgi:hypothetical protein
MELPQHHIHDLMKRFPSFELSYETISHKKVSPSYNLCLAIPQGKKCYVWFTFHGDKDVCILFDMNREKKITRATIIDIEFKNRLELGTVLYGSLIDEDKPTKFFVIEDIFFYKGISTKKSNQEDKLNIIRDFMENITPKPSDYILVFSIPVLWTIENKEDFECPAGIPDKMKDRLGYQVHHIQYRCLNEIKPYLNVFINKKLNFTNAVVQDSKKEKLPVFDTIDIKYDYSKPQYKYPTVFQVTADIQFDIYHLFCYGANNKQVYYGIAGIPNYKTSVFMNGLFRNIKENLNLDAIEESDDEEEFEDMTEDKYVDIQKVLLMECTFHHKFKKWVPLRVVDNSFKVIHISKLQFIPGEKRVEHNHNKQQYRPTYNGYSERSNSERNNSERNNSERSNSERSNSERSKPFHRGANNSNRNSNNNNTPPYKQHYKPKYLVASK